MRYLSMLAVSLMVVGATIHAQQSPATSRGGAGRDATTQPPAPPAPPPGSPGTYKSDADLMAVLEKAMGGTTEMSTSAVANTDQYRINLVHRAKPAGAIAHPGNTELHYIIEGSGTIVTGGSIVRPSGGDASSATIENGDTRRMRKGDIIIVPANSPHWYKEVEGSITYLEVRFVAPAK